MMSHSLVVIGKLALGKCQICNSFFELGDMTKKHLMWGNLVRENVSKAVRYEKGLVFWNYEVAQRKDKTGIKPLNDEDINILLR